MKKHFTLKKSVLFVALLLLILQLFTIDKTTKPVDATKDFISVTNSNIEVAHLLKIACYDCHSNQPNYPWYTSVAPISWWIKHHINEGLHHLNFSEWQTFSVKKQNHKLDECVEMIEEEAMPMQTYTWMHGEAKLNDAQRLLLVNWFKAIKEQTQNGSNNNN